MAGEDRFDSLVKKANSVLILASRSLDFDCISSSLLLKKYLESLGKIAVVYYPKKISSKERDYFSFLPYFNEITFKDTREVLSSPQFDLLILLDGCNLIQFYDEDINLPPPTLDKYKNRIQIDHHHSHPEKLAPLEILDPEASSTTEIILTKIIPKNFLDKRKATLSYAGIIGDTGNFRWNFNAQTLKLAGELMEKGASVLEVVNREFFFKDRGYLKMFSYTVSNSLYDDEIKTVWLSLPYKKIKEDKLSAEDLVDIKGIFTQEISRSIKGFERGIVMIEKMPNKVYISCRGDSLANKIDLPEVLSKLGGNGGGHFNACGITMEGDFIKIKKDLSRHLTVSLEVLI